MRSLFKNINKIFFLTIWLNKNIGVERITRFISHLQLQIRYGFIRSLCKKKGGKRIRKVCLWSWSVFVFCCWQTSLIPMVFLCHQSRTSFIYQTMSSLGEKFLFLPLYLFFYQTSLWTNPSDKLSPLSGPQEVLSLSKDMSCSYGPSMPLSAGAEMKSST